jgi:predicted transcriptional regulator
VAVFRVHKTDNYTVMSNHHLRNKELSLKAKGLLSVILSLPDTWKYSIAGLAAICKEGTTAVKSALDELESAGYVVVTKMYPGQTESGRIEYAYDIYEKPQMKQGIGNLGVECQGVENQAQLSIDKSNTYNKKGMRKKREKYPPLVPCACGGIMVKTATCKSGTDIPYYRCPECGEERLYR